MAGSAALVSGGNHARTDGFNLIAAALSPNLHRPGPHPRPPPPTTVCASADPAGIVRSTPGVGVVGARPALGRLDDVGRFRNLASVRSFSDHVPRRDDTVIAGGPTHIDGTPIIDTREGAFDNSGRSEF